MRQAKNVERQLRLDTRDLRRTIQREKDPLKALQIFKNPQTAIRHTHSTYDAIILKLSNAKKFTEMEGILHQLSNEKTITCKEGLLCHVIKAYGRCRRAEAAMDLFNKLHEFGHQKPSIRFFNTLLNALIDSKRYDLFHSVHKNISVTADSCTYNILIKAACLEGFFEDAWQLFDKMPDRNMVTYGTLIAGLCGDGNRENVDKAFRLFEEMKSKQLYPNVYVYTAIIGGFCSVGMVDEALKLKGEMVGKMLRPDSVTYTSLINGLFKGGRSEEVGKMLEEMSKSGCVLHTATYNIFITHLCKQCNFEGALEFLDVMWSIFGKQDVVSCNIIMGGLCREARVEEAFELYEDMPRRGCVADVITYRTLFDGFCRTGKFQKAAMLLDQMGLKGFVPRSSSVSELICGLCKEGEFNLALVVVTSMAKKCFVELSAWNALMPHILAQSDQKTALELMNHIVKESK